MSEDSIPTILTAMTAHLMAVISPGPDFVLITRNSLVYSRKTGVYSAIGLGLGILVHVTYSLVGIALLISKSIVLFNVIKLLGALYLLNIAYNSLKSHSHVKQQSISEKSKEISPLAAVKMGFITNATNPKATLFFLSLFTLVIKPDTSIAIKLFIGLEMAVVTFLWFAFVAYIFSHHLLKNRIERFQNIAEKVMGIILIVIGVKLIVSML